MNVRLVPVETPSNPLMRVAYWITKNQYGKVITPLKTIYARLPFAFSLWSNKIKSLEKKLSISEELILLIKIYVAQLNACSFCIDIGKAIAIQKFKEREKFYKVRDFENDPDFNDKERAALRFAAELTQYKKVSDETYEASKKHLTEKELIGVSWAVASEHYYNLMNIPFEVGSDGLCTIVKR